MNSSTTGHNMNDGASEASDAQGNGELQKLLEDSHQPEEMKVKQISTKSDAKLEEHTGGWRGVLSDPSKSR